MGELLKFHKPDTSHTTKYYQDFFAFPDLSPTDVEKIDPSGPSGKNSAAIDASIIRLRKHLDRLHAIEVTMGSPGWQYIENKALVSIKAMEQQLIWEAIKKGDSNEVVQITSEHDGILAFFNLIDPLQAKIDEVKLQLAEKEEQRLVYVDVPEPERK